MEFNEERVKILAITTLKAARKKISIDAIGSTIAGGIDALLVMLINNNVGIDVLRWIGIAIFGIAGVKNVGSIVKDLYGIITTSIGIGRLKKHQFSIDETGEYTVKENEYSIK